MAHSVLSLTFSSLSVPPDDSTIDMAKSTRTESLLTGLRKYTEYNITVLAYTGGGDGPRSRFALCHTEEDGRRR